MIFLLDEPGACVELEYAAGSCDGSSSSFEPDWPAAMPTLELPFDGWSDSDTELQGPAPADEGLPGAGGILDRPPGGLQLEVPAGAGGGREAAAGSCGQAGLPAPQVAAPSGRQPQLSHSSGRLPRPPGMNQDALLRLLAEAYGQMMLQRSGRHGGVQSEEELEGWLRQLRELALSGDGDTVLALFSALRAQHSWARLRDVYSALVRLRESHHLADGKPAGDRPS